VIKEKGYERGSRIIEGERNTTTHREGKEKGLKKEKEGESHAIKRGRCRGLFSKKKLGCRSPGGSNKGGKTAGYLGTVRKKPRKGRQRDSSTKEDCTPS